MAVFSASLRSAKSTVTLSVDPIYAAAPVGVTIRVHIPPDPTNRLVAVAVECDNYSTASDQPLNGDDSDPPFYTLTIPRLPIGECAVAAGVVRGGTVVRATPRSFARH